MAQGEKGPYLKGISINEVVRLCANALNRIPDVMSSILHVHNGDKAAADAESIKLINALADVIEKHGVNMGVSLMAVINLLGSLENEIEIQMATMQTADVGAKTVEN